MLGRRDDSRFSDYFAARSAAMRRTAYVVLGDWQLAEDAVQSAFAKVYVAWPRVREETREGYVRRAVVNESLSLLRKRRRHREESLADPPDIAVTDSPGALGDVVAALGRLPGRQRAVVALRFIDDLSVAEVADVLGIAHGTVKSQTARALASLREQLDGELVPTSRGETR